MEILKFINGSLEQHHYNLTLKFTRMKDSLTSVKALVEPCNSFKILNSLFFHVCGSKHFLSTPRFLKKQRNR